MRCLPLVLLLVGCVEYDPIGGVDPDGTLDEELPGGPPSEGDIPEGSALDAYDLPQADSIDVLVYGDNSSSMEEELQTLGETITPFVERLAEQVADWQLAAITGNTGCSGSGILTPGTADFAGQFANAITTASGDEDQDEMAFQNVALVVENSGPGTCNDGLIRGGLLHLIFVSDENDESPGFDGSTDYWREYWDRVVAIHGNSGAIVISAVAGDTPGGCAIGDATADPGDGYDVAVAETGGEFLSICSDWASQIDLLADAGTVRTEFELSETPVPGSIQVWVNQTLRGAGDWMYEPAGNKVVFLLNPPSPGDQVDVLYEVASR